MNSRRAPTRMLRRAFVLSIALLLAACAAHPQKKPAPVATSTTHAPAHAPTHKPWKPLGPYTPGGLYAPGVADGTPDIPPDIANLPEPVPHAEPLSRYGNRSPYAVLGKTYNVLPSAAGYVERGVASWYGTKFDGRATSSFEPYDVNQFSAAHRTLPLPSYARVSNLENGRSVIVRINDRGPFHDGRLIDLSYAAAIKLGVNVHGTAKVEVRGIDPGQALPAAPSATPATDDAASATHTAASPKPAPPKQVGSETALPQPALVLVPKATTAARETPTVGPARAAHAADIANSTLGSVAIAGTLPSTASPPIAMPDAASAPLQPLPERPLIEPSTRGFLQLASYSDRANAERMLQRVQQAGVDKVELVSVQIDGQILWRVHVGPLRADEAERVAEHLDTLGFGNPPFFKD